MKNVRGTAKVQITVEVDAGAWGDNCKLDQLYDQAANSALTTLRNAVSKLNGVRIIGEPKVIGIITRDS